VDSDSVTFRDDDGSPSNMVISQTGIDVTGTANVGVSRITGQNLAHSASTLAIGHEGSSKSQLRAYGANSSTTGSLEFMVSNSSGGGSHSMVLDSSGDLNIVNTGQASLNYTTDGSLDYARITGGKSGSGAGDLRFFTYSGGIAERARLTSHGDFVVGSTTADVINGTTAGVSLKQS
jgi:hypothetical protein